MRGTIPMLLVSGLLFAGCAKKKPAPEAQPTTEGERVSESEQADPKVDPILKAGPGVGKSVLVACGYNKTVGESDLTGAIYYSEDEGKTWELVWDTDERDFMIRDVIWLPELKQFVAFGSFDPGGYYKGEGTFLVLYSHDGKTWTKTRPKLQWDAVEINYCPKELAYGDGFLVGVGPSASMVYTRDGVTWHHVLEYEPGDRPRAKAEAWYEKTEGGKRIPYNTVSWINGRFLISGQGHMALYLKPQDGRLAFAEVVTNGSKGLAAAAATDGGEKVVLLGSMNFDYYSHDGGKSFRKVKRFTQYDVSSVIYAQDKFVCSSSSGKIGFSTDGKKWHDAEITPGASDRVHDVVFGGGKFYAARSYSGRADTLVSPDGETWAGNRGKLLDEEGVEMNFLGIAHGE